MTREISHFIAGQLVAGRSGRTAPVYNPATGEVAAQVALASTEELRKAVASAKAAAPGWAGTTPLRRYRILNKFLQILDEHIDELAAVITAEHGKVLSMRKAKSSVAWKW